MDTRRLLKELSDDELKARVASLTEHMRGQLGTERMEMLRDIAALIRARRILSEAKRPDPSDRQTHRGALPRRYWPEPQD